MDEQIPAARRRAMGAMSLSVTAWAAFMSVWAVASKVALFLISYATMRYIGIRRHRAQMSPALP